MFLVDHEVGHRTGLAEKEARRPRVIGVLGDVTITVGVDDQASQAKLSTARALPCSARSPHSSHDCRVLILRQTFLLTVGFDADILVLSASVKRGLADIGTRLLTICEPRRDHHQITSIFGAEACAIGPTTKAGRVGVPGSPVWAGWVALSHELRSLVRCLLRARCG